MSGEQMKLFVVDKVDNVTQDAADVFGAKERPVEAHGDRRVHRVTDVLAAVLPERLRSGARVPALAVAEPPCAFGTGAAANLPLDMASRTCKLCLSAHGSGRMVGDDQGLSLAALLNGHQPCLPCPRPLALLPLHERGLCASCDRTAAGVRERGLDVRYRAAGRSFSRSARPGVRAAAGHERGARHHRFWSRSLQDGA
jgi:hypothetical protein